MRIAICTPVTHGGSVLVWRRLLEDRGHSVRLVHDVVADAFDAAIHYGHQPAARRSLDAARRAEAARDGLAARRVPLLNSPAASAVVADKLRCGERFESAGLPHPTLSPSSHDRLVVKPRRGSCGVGVMCDLSHEEAIEAVRTAGCETIVQRYVPGRTLRVVASRRRALYAYEKIGDSPVASVSRGATRRPVPLDRSLADLAVAAVAALDADLLGLDVLRGEREDWILEANTGFAVYGRDIRTHPILADEFERLMGEGR